MAKTVLQVAPPILPVPEGVALVVPAVGSFEVPQGTGAHDAWQHAGVGETGHVVPAGQPIQLLSTPALCRGERERKGTHTVT